MKSSTSTLLPAAFAALALGTGCGSNHSPTEPRTVTNIAGTWRGNLHPGVGRSFDPCLPPAAATATIVQDGTRVSGTVTIESDFRGGALEGEFRSGSLTGTLRTSMETISVTGGALPAGFGITVGRLTISFFSPGQCGPNTIELER
jgi:hypothetical protein